MVVAVIFLVVVTPLTMPPLVVGMDDGSGVTLGLAVGTTEGVGEGEAVIDGVAEGEGESLFMNLVVAVKVR